MTTNQRLGLAAAALVVVALIGYQLIRGSNVGGPGPSPSQQPSSTSGPTATAEPSAPADGSLPVGSAHVLWDDSNGIWDGSSSLGVKIVVTIPAPGWFGGVGEAVLTKNGNASSPDGAEVRVFARTNDLIVGAGDVYVYGDPCNWESTKPTVPVTTVDEAVAALSAQPSRDPSAAVDVTYGGNAGKYITLHMLDGVAFSDCDGGEFRTLVQGGAALSEHDPGQIDLLTILNVSGPLVIFDVAYHDGTPASVLDEMAAIVTHATILYQP
jgi:hypothetical protein